MTVCKSEKNWKMDGQSYFDIDGKEFGRQYYPAKDTFDIHAAYTYDTEFSIYVDKIRQLGFNISIDGVKYIHQLVLPNEPTSIIHTHPEAKENIQHWICKT